MGEEVTTDVLKNKGIVAINKVPNPGVNKTVVVLGIPRSGTTMVAKVLEGLGVFMGETNPNSVAEDTQISRLLEKNRDEHALKKLIASRDSQHQVWGWKRPEAFRYIDRFKDLITRPHFVIVFRDPLAIAIREQISMESDLFKNLQHAQNRYTNILRFVSSTDIPCLLVSYEKAITKQGDFVRALAQFLDLEAEKKVIKLAKKAIRLDDETYLKGSRKKKNRIRGVLDGIEQGIVRGWAYQNGSAEAVKLEVLVNSEVVEHCTADRFRKGLEKKGIGKGYHGFECDISKFLQNETGQNKVAVRTISSQHELNKSPLNI